MTRREAMRQSMMFDRLRSLGFTQDEAEQLRRISLTLSHWAERECNEDIRRGFLRDGKVVDCSNEQECREQGKTRRTWLVWTKHDGSEGHYTIPDRESGALRRLRAIMANHPNLTYYHQTDPRGAALYIVVRKRLQEYNRGKDKPTPLDCCYSSIGLAVY
jgi:hypothetical protein